MGLSLLPGPGCELHTDRMVGIKERDAKEKNGQAFGWISGLGAVIIPWIVAGVGSSFAGTISQDWNPEITFPKFLLGAVAAMIIWLIYGSVLIPGFRRGALIGSSISFGFVAVIYLVILFFQP